jgi:2-phosphosulfolactate phosphatase
VSRVVGVGCAHGHLGDEIQGWTIVAVDVIRAATTAVTAVASGRRCFPVPSIEAAVPLAARLDDPVLAGELGGSMPYGFHLQNSPSEVANLDGSERPVILLATSGTRLMCEAAMHGAARVACLRNARAAAAELAEGHEAVEVLGADSRGQFRDEDQLCCARIARTLIDRGYDPVDPLTEEVVERWGDAPDDAFLGGRSSEYLRTSGQQHDLDFVLSHVDDLNAAFEVKQGEVMRVAL